MKSSTYVTLLIFIAVIQLGPSHPCTQPLATALGLIAVLLQEAGH